MEKSPEFIMHSSTETPLTELGHKQAKKVGQRLKDTAFDMTFSSDLSRAYDTALAIVKDPGAITTDPLLRERDYGRFENKPIQVYHDAKKLHFGDRKTDLDSEKRMAIEFFAISVSENMRNTFYPSLAINPC